MGKRKQYIEKLEPKPPKDPKRRYAYHLTNYAERQKKIADKYAAPCSEKVNAHAFYTSNNERTYIKK